MTFFIFDATLIRRHINPSFIRKKMSCNIRELAKQAGVSPATVSRVLNDYPYVKPEVRKRVIAAAQKNNYSLYKNCYLVILPENANFGGYLGLILKALQKEAFQRNYHLSISTEQDLSYTSGAHLFDGVISLQVKTGLEKRWSMNEILPMVCVNSLGQKSSNILRVSSDNRQGIYLALDYLKSKGHSRIAFVATDSRLPEDSVDVQERQQFYRKWVQENFPGFKPVFCSLPTQNLCGRKAGSFLKELIRDGITALLVPGEGASALLYYHLNAQKIKVPRDLSIIGMEHKEISFALTPPETAIGQNWDLLAAGAFDTLEKIQQKIPVHDLSIPFQLFERKSVADLNKRK